LGLVSRFSQGSESPELFSKIWKAFEDHHAGIKELSTDACYYGVTFPGAEAGEMEYLAGMAIQQDAPVPLGTEARTIPSGEYAIIACAVSDIGRTYRYIFTEWLPWTDLDVRPGAASFEQYPPEGEEGSPILIHIPVRKKNRGVD
jgi:predicted transcriptional regulator YdeE